MQDIDREIVEKYDLNIASVSPYKDAYIIGCNKGKKVLRKVGLSSDRVGFVHDAKEHLYKNGFTNLDRYLCTLEGKPYVELNGSTYVISDFIDGKECNFSCREDVVKSSRALAALHKASRGFKPQVYLKTRDELGKLPFSFAKRLEEIKKLKKIAKKGKSKFDYLFLKYVDYFYDLGENTLEQLASSRYEELCEFTREAGIICHHDYTHTNILCSEKGVSVINFDFCCFELKVYDIANLLRRKMRKCNWDVKEAAVILREYQSIEALTEDDFQIMRLILQFPQKFWRVVNKFYNSRRSWSEKGYVSNLQEVIDELEPHRKFMEQYERLAGKYTPHENK